MQSSYAVPLLPSIPVIHWKADNYGVLCGTKANDWNNMFLCICALSYWLNTKRMMHSKLKRRKNRSKIIHYFASMFINKELVCPGPVPLAHSRKQKDSASVSGLATRGGRTVSLFSQAFSKLVATPPPPDRSRERTLFFLSSWPPHLSLMIAKEPSYMVLLPRRGQPWNIWEGGKRWENIRIGVVASFAKSRRTERPNCMRIDCRSFYLCDPRFC